MTKDKLRFIVSLVSLALLFLIGFQIFWLRNSYKVLETQLTQRVRTAMNIAQESSLEKKFESISKNIRASDLVRELDELQKGLYGIDSDIQISIPNDNDGIQMDADSVSVRVFSALKSSENLSAEFEEFIQLLETTKQKNELLEMLKNEEVQKISQGVFNELDFQIIEEVLRSELSKLSGIESYVFGIFEEKQQEFIKISNPDIANNFLMNSKTISEPIYLPDEEHFARSYFLKVRLIGQNEVLLRQMLPSLMASFLLILIVAGGYYFTINTILKQKKLSEIKTDFINNMTHELKTPIANVSLSIESLQKFKVLENKVKTEEYLGIAKKENARLADMVEQVLKISLFDNKQSQTAFEDVDMHQIIEEVVSALSIQTDYKNGTIETGLTAENYTIRGNSEDLRNVVFNLIDNGIKYSFGRKPTILVSTKNENNHLIISINDHGIGISKKYLDSIFDKFFRVPTGDVQNVKGFGLGLSYVHHIVEQHEGTIRVESELGVGSEFIITIPNE